jgi:hypothetical protein
MPQHPLPEIPNISLMGPQRLPQIYYQLNEGTPLYSCCCIFLFPKALAPLAWKQNGNCLPKHKGVSYKGFIRPFKAPVEALERLYKGLHVL